MDVEALNAAVIGGLRTDRDACLGAIRRTMEFVDVLSRDGSADPASAVDEAVYAQDLYLRVLLAVDYLRETGRFRFTALDAMDRRSPLLIYARALGAAADGDRSGLAVTILQTLKNMVDALEAVTATAG
ncbi:MAG: hypothetical protein ABR591_15080 [Candidatus Velthaea sp.]